MMPDHTILEAVFGKDSSGNTAEQRASSSSQLFVRSQHQLSIFNAGATGRIINAVEALRLFGWDALKELADHSATPILENSGEPYSSISGQLDRLGLKFSEIASKVGWKNDEIRRFEQKKQVPFRALESLAQKIDLDEARLGIVAASGADKKLSVRLKKYTNDDPKRFTVNAVLALTEAAWLIRKQVELAMLIGGKPRAAIENYGFKFSDDYGSKLSPDYRKGYELARKTRELLGIPAEEPIPSLKELIESKLCVPVIQLELNQEFAGATVASGVDRGIAINLNGENSSPFVRRMVLAHELGHLLWDPDQRLNRLRVDRYDEIQTDVQSGNAPDRIERRANAFAVEFLAPGDAIQKEFERAGKGAAGLAHIIGRFGVSRTAIMRHLTNASFNRIGAVEGALPAISQNEWDNNELLAIPLFRPEDVPVPRRGRFGHYVQEAHSRGLISDDTAASLFKCNFSDLSQALKTVRDLVK